MKRCSKFFVVLSLGFFLAGADSLWAEAAGGQTVPSAAVPAMQATQAADPAQNIYVDVTTGNFGVGYARSSSSSAVRFLSFNEVDAERQQSISDDTAILKHLIGKSMSSPRSRNALGVTVWQYSDSNEATYVDGVGLFLILSADRPVAPTAEDTANQKGDKADVSEWERAKQEIEQGPAGATFSGATAFPSEVVAYGNFAGVKPSYVAEYVDELDATVSKALGQAGNFRALAPSDSVTVIAYGPGSAAGERTIFAWRVRISDADSDKTIPESKIERRQGLEKVSKTTYRFRTTPAR